jgi:myo-inositol 2-dehydrogenase / D-chiro-inositol 1-dehydrogenase
MSAAIQARLWGISLSRKSSSKPVGIVVIGAGTMGGFHAESVANLKQANLIAVVDPAEKRAKAVARRLGCRAYADADEALSRPDVEAVVIVTPERIRQAPIAAALARRLPIFLEKPLAITLAEGKGLVRQIKAARVPFQIGFQRRYDPDIVAIKDTLVKWGPPEIVRSLTRDPVPPSLEAGLRCGGIVIATLIHDIDCSQFLAGPIRSVFARGGKLVAKHDHPDWFDTLVANVEFASGALGILEASWRAAYGYDSRVEVHARGGMLQAGGARGGRWHGRDGASTRYPVGFLQCFAEAYRQEIASFAQSVHAGTPPRPSLDEALSALRVADAILRSLKTGKPVALPG